MLNQKFFKQDYKNLTILPEYIVTCRQDQGQIYSGTALL